MDKCGKDILIAREGTEQQQRFIDALNPDSVKLNDFEVKEWMRFAYSFASQVNYFSFDNHKTPSGDWRDFFKAEDELEEFLNEVEDGKTVTPHLALFVVFVKLIELTKKRFNKLTQRHLDFYYQQVLNIQKQPATPDKVHVLFELAKNAVAEKIPEKTELDGGKDADGNKLIYETTEELVANQTKVALLKNVYNDHTNHKLKAAPVANSFDGNGEDFPNNEIKWWPFGYYEVPPAPEQTDLREYPALADGNDAKIGFAIAGEILELQEGERNIQISLNLDTELSTAVAASELFATLEMYCTGEKGWLGPFNIVENVLDADDNPIYLSGSDSSDNKILNIVFQIPKDEKAVVKYDSKVHAENFNTNYPVCRILFKTKEIKAYQLYRQLVDKQIVKLATSVTVRGVSGLNLFNDIGNINSKKPFYPFGTQPVKKSKFYVDYAELYKKRWEKLSVNIEWKNTPDDFKTWYYAYRDSFIDEISPNKFWEEMYVFLKDDTVAMKDMEPLSLLQEKPDPDLMKDGITIQPQIDGVQANTPTNVNEVIQAGKWQIVEDPDNLIVESEDYFTAKIEYKEKEEWKGLGGKSEEKLFESPINGIFRMNLAVTNPVAFTEKIGPIRLSLNQTFKHEMYPRLYALAMSSKEENVIIPNEPYTPFIEQISLDYSAKAEILVVNKKYETKDFDLFHEHPFGQAEECIDLKNKNTVVPAAEAEKLSIVPSYCKGGELYIGLENAKNKQTVSLLIQVLEGSENPDNEGFVGKQKVEWWILCNNHWKELDSNSIISDDTGNFLKSGILKFSIPKEATDTNSVLPTGYFWLKARIHKNFDAVSKTIGIYAQAVVAGFNNNGNNLSHLNDGLAAETISKMVKRIPKVKGVEQPYNSFDGKPEETNSAYYRRISERLRHKNRAINIWDYENLILQNFPEIHKVKCLNHTSSSVLDNERLTNYLAPGNVVLVVIPDIINKNVFDIYQPRVSKATLTKIQDFINKLNSPLVKAKVINPEYEELKVKLKVQFHKGYDEVYYQKVLAEDLTRLLSPWAFDNTASIQFGLSLHKSVIIHYAEKLDYVDFVSEVKLFQNNSDTDIDAAIPSSPIAIIVSSRYHDVKLAINNCSNITIEPTETCQQ